MQVCVDIVKCSHFDSISGFTHRCQFLYAYNILRFNFKADAVYKNSGARGISLLVPFCSVTSDFLMIIFYDLIFI